jgi:adenylate kinase family enzyme
MRCVVVGTSGSGKTTLAQELAQSLGAPCLELDALHWSENWTPNSTAKFVDSVALATQGTHWVVDGNYSAVRHVVWPRASHVVWLNFGRSVVFPRIVWRSVKRALFKQTLWHGNTESFRTAFFSRQSILLWSFSTFSKNRVKYSALRNDPAYSHLHWVELTSPDQAKQFLANAKPSRDGRRNDGVHQ